MVVNSESSAGHQLQQANGSKTGKKKRSSTGEKSKKSSSSSSAAAAISAVTCDYPLVDHEDRRHRREKYTITNDADEHHYDRPRRSRHHKRAVAVEHDDHLYDVVRPRADNDDANTYQNVVIAAADSAAVYQNMDDLYDHPVRNGKKKSGATLVQSHYQNLAFDDQRPVASDEGEEEDHTYLNLTAATYDIPRSMAASIYDQPRSNHQPVQPDNGDYDYPKGLIPLSARLLLNASRQNLNQIDDEEEEDDREEECDADSLDGHPSPTDDIDDGLTEVRSGSSPDEGIGTELDPKGLLGVIAEEDEGAVENENCYTNLMELKSMKKNKSKKNKRRSPEGEHRQQQNGKERHNEDVQPESQKPTAEPGEQEDRTQRDRCIEVYHETLRQRNNKTGKGKNRGELVSVYSSKEENEENFSTIRRMKKFLPSVRLLRSQFESRSKQEANKVIQPTAVRKWKSTSSFMHNDSSSAASTASSSSSGTGGMTDAERSRSRSSSLGSLDEIASTTSSAGSSCGSKNIINPITAPNYDRAAKLLERSASNVSIIQPIMPLSDNKTEKEKEYDLYPTRHSTAQWNPTALLNQLYKIQEPADDKENRGKSDEPNGNDTDKTNDKPINMDGPLEKLPSGRRKATFWNAWKRRYFQIKDGQLFCYQNSQSEKPSVVLQLVGGQVEMDNNMISIDDGKGHCVVVRGSSKADTDRWYHAILTHVTYNGGQPLVNYVVPQALPKDPKLLKNVIVLDLGTSSVRAGILSACATLPQVFFPSVAAVDKTSGRYVAFGVQAALPDIRANSNMVHPLRSSKISKFMLDMEGVAGLMRSAFQQLNVDPSTYEIQVSLPRRLNHATQAELTRLLFEEFGLQSVNLTHQSVLSMLSYNSTTGIVVDIGERIDIVPIMDGYMLETSASQVPYGGQQLVDHLRHFLVQQRCSLITDVESYLIRYILEELAYVAGPDAGAYNIELNKAKNDSSSVRGTVDLKPFSNGHLPWESISLELGRFQVTEGLFHPEAWGLDNPGVQRLINKAIQDCSVDIRKEMVRSIFLSGGVTLLPNFPERLESELNRLTPSHLVPKVHASPYRYHAAFLGACALSNSPTYDHAKIARDEWRTSGSEAVRKWKP